MNTFSGSEEWQQLYECVTSVCSNYGTENAFGEADFWVIDDCWGGASQKIVITNPFFLTKKLVSELSECIVRLNLLGAEIIIAIETGERGNVEEPNGLVVHSGGFVEYWNLDSLRKKYGHAFFT